MTGLRIDHYDWSGDGTRDDAAGGREAMLRFGPDTGPVAILALPLFEEANRTRRFAVTILRRLAERGIASLLPDVPGQGESLATLPSLADMQAAMAAVTDRCLREGRRTYAVGVRSGALLDGRARHHGRWHLSPQTGADLLRDLHRIRRAAGHDGALDAQLAAVEIAGNLIPQDLLSALAHAMPDGGNGITPRAVRLSGDPRPADRVVEGAPLWRRGEPGENDILSQCLADDIAQWIAACEA